MIINPKEIKGSWDKGYTLDRHSIKSIPIGMYPNGRPIFDTKRTELGELLYNFKNKDKYENLRSINEVVCEFLCRWDNINGVEVVIPVPPSNKTRKYQPTREIAKEVASFLGASYEDILIKVDNEEMKNADFRKPLSGRIKIKSLIHGGTKILLIDDLYGTGKTLNECVRVIREGNYINEIYVLALTRKKGV